MKKRIITALLPLLAATALHAQTPPSIPGVPEPGLTIWGTVTNSANGQSITITSASWTLTDNLAAPNTPTSFTLSSTVAPGAESKPQVRLITQGAQTYYVMQVPFDTRTLGSGAGAVTLGDPNQQTDTALRYPSFALKTASPPTYTMMPTINGLPANLKSVDGQAIAAAPANFTVPLSGAPTPNNTGFTFGERARVVRVDLTITPPADPYDEWAISFFPGHPTPQSGQTMDPDGDGQNNLSEYQSGTNPIQNTSVLRILTLTRAVNGATVTLNWLSVAGKKYQVETSLTGQGGANPWTAVGAQVTAGGTSAAQAVTATPGETRRLYRVKVVP